MNITFSSHVKLNGCIYICIRIYKVPAWSIVLYSFCLQYVSLTILPLQVKNFAVWMAPRIWSIAYCKTKKSNYVIKASIWTLQSRHLEICTKFSITKLEDIILDSLVNKLVDNFYALKIYCRYQQKTCMEKANEWIEPLLLAQSYANCCDIMWLVIHNLLVWFGIAVLCDLYLNMSSNPDIWFLPFCISHLFKASV